MVDTPEIVYTIAASLSSAALVLGGGYKVFDAMLEKKLLQMETSLLNRINGTYIRRFECSLLHEQSSRDFHGVHQTVLELKEGLELIKTKMIEKGINNH